jgi:hypothetical protein
VHLTPQAHVHFYTLASGKRMIAEADSSLDEALIWFQTLEANIARIEAGLALLEGWYGENKNKKMDDAQKWILVVQTSLKGQPRMR